MFNYALMALVLLAFFIWGINYITLGAIILTSFCLVYLEPAKEMYLYEKLKISDEEHMQPVYATSEIVGSIVTRLLIGLILLYFSQSISFAFMAIIMGLIAWHARRIKN